VRVARLSGSGSSDTYSSSTGFLQVIFITNAKGNGDKPGFEAA